MVRGVDRPRTIAVRRHIVIMYLYTESLGVGVMFKLSVPQGSNVLVGDCIRWVFPLCVWLHARTNVHLWRHDVLRDYAHVVSCGSQDRATSPEHITFPLRPTSGRTYAYSLPLLSVPCVGNSLRGEGSEKRIPFLRIVKASRRTKQTPLAANQPMSHVIRQLESKSFGPDIDSSNGLSRGSQV